MIAIATTSYAPLNSEERVITNVLQDGHVLEFAEPLLYDHIGMYLFPIPMGVEEEVARRY